MIPQMPRVTEILEATGYVYTQWYTKESANRGTEIHLFTTLIDDGLLNDDDYPEKYQGYLEAYQQFLTDNVVKIIETEKEVIYNGEFPYIGHLDRIIELNGEKYIIDIKTGSVGLAGALQLNAYQLAYGDLDCGLAILQLKDNGKYSFRTEYRNENIKAFREDWLIALRRFYQLRGLI